MQTTDNTRAFIEAEQYSSFILLNLHDGLLPETFWRNVADFGTGEVLHIKSIGTVTIQDAEEDTPLIYNPIETGEIQFRISEYKGDAWYVTDDLREDGTDIDALLSARAAESTRALQEVFETDFLNTIGDYFKANTGPHNVNGFAHMIVAPGTNHALELSDLINLRLAFDKANVPYEGRVLIVDPIVEATLNNLVTITHDVTPFGQKILEQGLASGQRFMMQLFGWMIITSNRLPTGAFNDGTNTVTGVLNIAMNVLSDQTKPVIGAWRRPPKSEGERNKDLARDEYVVRARYGFGLQRVDTLGGIATSTTAISN